MALPVFRAVFFPVSPCCARGSGYISAPKISPRAPFPAPRAHIAGDYDVHGGRQGRSFVEPGRLVPEGRRVSRGTLHTGLDPGAFPRSPPARAPGRTPRAPSRELSHFSPRASRQVAQAPQGGMFQYLIYGHTHNTVGPKKRPAYMRVVSDVLGI